MYLWSAWQADPQKIFSFSNPTRFAVSREKFFFKMRQRSFSVGYFRLKLLFIRFGWYSIPLPTFSWTIWWIKTFSLPTKTEGVTVPAHFLQNGGCDVIQVTFPKNEKSATGKCLPDLKSKVSLKSAQPFRR